MSATSSAADLAASAAASKVMTAAEYSDQVAAWLQLAYNSQMMALSNLNNLYRQQQELPQAQAAPPQPQFREFRIPPLWKRFAAEFLDFLSLFVVKLAVTFIAVDTFELIDFEAFVSKYDSGLWAMLTGEDLAEGAAEAASATVDVAAAFELTSEIVLLEMIHRIVVCAFETLCTYRGPLGTQGGATPGKLMMGLRVFRCDQISMTGAPDRVRVSPATNLGIWWAALRAVLKNMSMAFLFPVSITFLFLPFNRTVYDVMSRSIVVEVDPPAARRIRIIRR